MTISTLAAGHVRSAGKPNSARRIAIRESLKDWCATCNLDLDWSAQVDDKAAHKGTFGHVLAEEVGGTWNVGNVVAQCWSCNWSAKCAGITDLSAYVNPAAIPTAYLPTKNVTSDRRTLAPRAGMVTDRKVRRQARVNAGGWA